MKKLTVIKILLYIITFFIIVISASYAYFVNVKIQNEEDISYGMNISTDQYLFKTETIDNINIVNTNMTNLELGDYLEDTGLIKIKTASNKPGTSLTCRFDVYYVWDSNNIYTSSDITFSEEYPYEYSVSVKLNDKKIISEKDLSNVSFNYNNSTRKYEGLLASNVRTKASNEVKEYNLSVENRIYSVLSLQSNIAGKTFSSHIEIRNVSCSEVQKEPILLDTSYNKTLLSFAQTSGLISNYYNITSIDIVDIHCHPVPRGATTVDYSRDGNNSVLAWIESGNKLYIGGEGGVISSNNLSYAFYGDNYSKVSYLNIELLDTSNATNMTVMFGSLHYMNNLNLSTFDTSNVTNMATMFYLTSLNSLDISSFNTSNVTNMHSMFSGATNLAVLNLSDFDTTNVINMGYMFNGLIKLNNLYLGINWNMDSSTNITNMFYISSPILTTNIYNAPQSFKDKTTSSWSGWNRTPNYIP